MHAVIKLDNITKIYKNLIAVNNLNLEIQKGGVIGFIGPNGAGKTTTLKLIARLIKPSFGNIFIADKNNTLQNIFAKHNKNINEMGFLIDIPHFYNTTPYRLLKYITCIRNYPKNERNQRIDEMLKLFNLYERKYDKIKNFSKGMKQLLGFIIAVINNPEIIILDEPQTGLDPNARVKIRKYIKSLQNQGKTIFVASHMLYEISEVCDKLALINHGELIGFDNIENFEDKLKSKEIICKIVDPIDPKRIKSLIETLSQHLDPYFDDNLGEEISRSPIVYNQQDKSFIICYDGKKESKAEILNILFSKFKNDFTINSFTEPLTTQLEKLYSQMVEKDNKIMKTESKM